MRRRLVIVSLCFAWICANGALWDAVQVFAWARMFAGYAQTMNFADAACETLDPTKPCEICLTVAKAKETERRQVPQAVERSAEKLVLACEPPAKIFLQPSARAWREAPPRVAASHIESVPVPPPRV